MSTTQTRKPAGSQAAPFTIPALHTAAVVALRRAAMNILNESGRKPSVALASFVDAVLADPEHSQALLIWAKDEFVEDICLAYLRELLTDTSNLDKAAEREKRLAAKAAQEEGARKRSNVHGGNPSPANIAGAKAARHLDVAAVYAVNTIEGRPIYEYSIGELKTAIPRMQRQIDHHSAEASRLKYEVSIAQRIVSHARVTDETTKVHEVVSVRKLNSIITAAKGESIA